MTPSPAASIRLTWLGHATVLVEDGARILTDPVLTDRVVHLHRRAGETPQTPEPDVVVVSHLHADHLHLPSLALLPAKTPVVVPKGAAGLLRRLRVRPVEVAAGDTVTVAGVNVTAVPAVHSGSRWPWRRLRCAALGYVLEGTGTTYFAGDTVEFAGMTDLPRLDLALLPVGGWGPWLRGQHLDPRTAAACLQLLEPAVCVPVHYATLWPIGVGWVRPSRFHDPGRAFAEHARSTAPEVDVRVLAPGTSTQIDCRDRSTGV
jgi:L-ascorbate metabolism protein UlaG (beta-lactamase superfamily)